MGCGAGMMINPKIAIADHLLETTRRVNDITLAREFVQRAINVIAAPHKHHGFKIDKRYVRNPVHGIKGRGVVADLEALASRTMFKKEFERNLETQIGRAFGAASRKSRSALAAAKRALAAKDLPRLRRHAQEARRHLQTALRMTVPAVNNARL